MGNIHLLLALLGIWCWRAAAQNGIFSIYVVASQIDGFLQLIQNGSLSTGQTSTGSLLPSGCALTCSFLNFALPGQVSYPNSTIYQYEESRYWSVQQASDTPTCRFSPTNASGVSLAVLTVQVTQCLFAVKSGGHAAFSGASNIHDGLTIDLLNLDEVIVSADNTSTSVGAGNRWVDAYSALQPKGLTIIGGRVADIGVGGLTLGGGMSFFSARYGWACDNINAYEVVFADGSIREVTYETYPDLYFALRGGGNNFGIVTRFEAMTFAQGDLWAGSETYLYSNETSASLNNALYWLNINGPTDNYAQCILAYAYVQSIDTYAIASDLQYGKPVVNPPILQNFTNTTGAFASTLRITNLTGLTLEFNNSNPGGNRQTYWTLTTKNSATLLSDIVSIFMEETNNIKNVSDILPSCVFQPITTALISHFSKNGGNALGVTTADGPLVLLNIAISWSSAANDELVMSAARSMVKRSNATAYAQGLGHPFVYQNYASLEQPVFASYGQENLAKLQAVSKKYDPKGVWQNLQPGYFKVL
ncbi:FAD-binding domain-containing protein [Acephala macrosclerotiorum]|nr:FAD-binding domain-containing protein [Acephala macrosclerotiorum]